MTTVDLIKMESTSSTNLCARSKKLPPPPLRLPATNVTTYEENASDLHAKRERRKSSNSCCLSSSSEDCPHKSVPFTLPISQRSQILETLTNSSSTLLVPLSSDSKHKRSSNSAHVNTINLLRQRPLSSLQNPVADTDWTEFIRSVVHQPFENELRALLDNYKKNYFDRVNAPNASDEAIRSSLCAMVSETMATYSSSSTLTTKISEELTTSAASPNSLMINPDSSNTSAKRKRKTMTSSLSPSPSAPIVVNSQTKFVISYIIPGKFDNTKTTVKTANQQQIKQFQKRYADLFKYVPDKEEKDYLMRGKSSKNSSGGPSLIDDHTNICFMLYEEVDNYMDKSDVELSGITLSGTFTLPEAIITRINSCT